MTRLLASLTLALGLAASGCGYMGAPQLGVTTGGAQDVGFARNLVAAGHVPEPSAFVIEGLLSEHDIALAHAPCTRLLCFDAAVGVAPAFDTGRDTAFMVVGFSSNLAPEELRRPALNLAVVLDHSGSMAGGKMAAAKEAVHRIIEQLGPDDRLTLIIFDDDVDVLARGLRVTESARDRLHRLVSRVSDDGSTDLEAALAAGFDALEDVRGEGRSDRVLLITDAQPTAGRQGKSAFVSLAEARAAEGYGLTVVGVGLDFGQELSLAISRMPGGNYIYLENEKKLAERLGDEFDKVVTPLAWDLEMRVEPLPGYRIVQAFGVPSWVADEGDGAVVIHLPTLFPSKNRGAIVLALEPREAAGRFGAGPVATERLSYRERREGEALAWEGEAVVGAVQEDDPGVARAVALVNTGLGLQAAAGLAHAGRHAAALDALARVEALVGDAEYGSEQKLVRDLARVIREDAERWADAHREGEAGGERLEEGDARWIR